MQGLKLLLLDGFKGHKPHVRSAGSFEDRLGIDRIILRTFHKRLDDAQVDQANGSPGVGMLS